MALSNILLKIAGDGDDAKRELADTAKDLAAFGRLEAEAEIKIAADQARRQLADTKGELAAFDGLTAEAKAALEADAALTQLDRLRERLRNLSAQEATPQVKMRMGQTVAQIERLEKKLAEFGRQDETATMRIDTEAAMANLAGVARSIQGLVRGPALIVFAGLAAQGLGALAGAAIGLIGALAPAGGALAAYPVLLSAVAQAAQTAKLAFLGVGTELGKLATKTLEKPTAETKAFTRELKPLIPLLGELRGVAQRDLLPGVSDGVKRAAANFPALRTVVAATGKVLGGLAREAGALVGSGGFGRDLQTVGLRNTKIIQTLGRAGLALVDALRHVVVAAGPLTSWLARLAGGWAENIRGAAQAGRESGRLAGFFEKTRAVLQRLGSIVGSVATGFFNIGRAATPLGNSILAAFDKAAQGFARFTGSADGQNKLAAYFEQIKPAVFEFGRLIRDAGAAFAGLAAAPGLQQLVETLRTQLLPALTGIVAGTTEAFGPTLITALAQIVNLFEAFVGSSGPLVIFVRTLGQIAGGSAKVLDKFPPLQAALVALAGGFAVLKAVRFAGMVSGITPLIGALRTLKAAEDGSALAAGRHRVATLASAAADRVKVAATAVSTAATTAWTAVTNGSALAAVRQRVAVIASAVAQRASAAATAIAAAATTAWTAITNLGAIAAVRHRIAVVASTVAMGVARGATIAWAAAQAVLNAVLLLNPIGLLIAAVVAVIAIVVLLVTKWEFARDALAAVWGAIKSAALAVWGAIKTGLVAIWNAIKSLATTYFNAYKTVILAVWNAIKTATAAVWNAIKSIVTTGANAVKAVVTAVWNAIKTATTAAWNAIKSAVSTAWGAIKSVVSSAGNAVKSAAIAVWNAVKSAASKAWGALKGIVADGLRGALGAITGVASAFFNAGKNLIEGLINGIKSMAGKVADAVKDIAQKARDVLPFSEPRDPSSPLRGLGKAGRAIGENVAAGIPRGARALANAMRSQLTDPLAGLVPSALGSMTADLAIAAPGRLAAPRLTGDRQAGPGDVNFGDINLNPAGGSMDPMDALTRLQMELRVRGVRAS